MKSAHTRSHLFIVAVLAFLLWSPSATHAGPGHTGTVIETIDAQRYTYVLITNKIDTTWVVGPKASIAVGDEVSIEQGMPMRDFFSKSLDRKFDLVYFVGSLKSRESHATSPHAPKGHPPLHGEAPRPGPTHLPKGHPPLQGKAQKAGSPHLLKGHPPLLDKSPKTAPTLDLKGINVPEGGLTIDALYKRKNSLAGKSVTLRGRAVRFSPDILKRNWLHIRDGSGADGDADITVTTTMHLSVGDLVTVTGTVALNRDFGPGYTYPVLIEKADIIIEGLQFPPSRLVTASGKNLDVEQLAEAEECSVCHEAQYDQWLGSGHSIAHKDTIYLAFAELARKEGGDALYVFCSACHIPAAVAAGEVPGNDEKKKTAHLFNDGVTCEACHRARDVTPAHRGAGANASLVLDDSDVRYGGIKEAKENDYHESTYSQLHTRSELCSACHTLIHPFNGVVIENSYQEWLKGPYASAGIQCQDCHMRTVNQAKKVAETMTPIQVPGKAAEDGPERPDSHQHLFVGANVNTAAGFGDDHAKAARERLRSAATMALKLPRKAAAGKELSLNVLVTNVGAGHAIPSSITELREVWIEVIATDGAGKVVYQNGVIQPDGSVDPEAVMYHSILHDKDGKKTYLPWQAVKLAEEHLILPKKTVTESYRFRLPPDASGTLSIKTRLRYRAAPQQIMDSLFGKGTFKIEVVDMTESHGQIEVTRGGLLDRFTQK